MGKLFDADGNLFINRQKKTVFQQIQEHMNQGEINEYLNFALIKAAVQIGLTMEQELQPLPISATKYRKHKKTFATEILMMFQEYIDMAANMEKQAKVDTTEETPHN